MQSNTPPMLDSGGSACLLSSRVCFCRTAFSRNERCHKGTESWDYVANLTHSPDPSCYLTIFAFSELHLAIGVFKAILLASAMARAMLLANFVVARPRRRFFCAFELRRFSFSSCFTASGSRMLGRVVVICSRQESAPSS